MATIVRRVFLGLSLATLASMTLTVSAQQEGASGMGTWKLNVEKSKFSPGPPPQSLTAKFEPAGNGVKATTEGVGPDGKPTATEYTAHWDGNDVPIKGNPLADTTSLRRIDADTTVRTDKKAGKEVMTLRRTVAKDGKTFTVDVRGTNAKGEPVENRLLFEKQ